MGNVSPKTANSTAIRSAIACALQVSWVPVVCYAQHVEWSGLPIECLLTLACYFAAVPFAVACVMRFMRETLKSDSGHVLDIGAIATYAFGIALLLTTPQAENSIPIGCIAFISVGCSSGISILQLERCLMCLAPKQTTFVALMTVFIACAIVFVLPFFPMPVALATSLFFVAASCLTRPRLERPRVDPSTIDSKLLQEKVESFNKRTAAAMLLLGAASTIPIALFISSDVPFISDSTQVAAMISTWSPLAFMLFAGIVVIGWLPNREPNPFGSLPGAFCNCAAQFLSHFPWQRIQHVARSDFQHGLGSVARRSHAACVVRNQSGICEMRPIRPWRKRHVPLHWSDCGTRYRGFRQELRPPICRNRWAEQRRHHAHLQHKHGLRNAAFPGNQYARHQGHAS